MTLEDFRDQVVAPYIEVLGQAYVESTAQNSAISRALERFTEDTYCLYSDRIAFTLTSGTAEYSMRDDAVFAKKMLRIMHVWVNSGLLLQVATQRDMTNLYETYLFDADGDPALWFTQGATKLVLHPPPDTAFSNSYVSGWYLHPTVSEEDDVLEIPDADIEAAAIECAIAIMRPRAAGSAKEHLESLKQELAGMKEEIRRRSFNTDSPAVLVRPKRSVYSL